MTTTTAPLPSLTDRVDGTLKTYATQLTAALSLIVGVSGIMMFFHIYKGQVEALHEWLGMAFVAAFALHAVRHRRPFVAMLSQRRTYALLLLTLVTATAFVLQAPDEKGNPGRRAAQALMQAPVVDTAKVLGLSVDEARQRLVVAGVANPVAEQSLASLARDEHREPFPLLMALMNGQDQPPNPGAK